MRHLEVCIEQQMTFVESDVSFCWKQRVVLLKVTYRFVENNVSFFEEKSLSFDGAESSGWLFSLLPPANSWGWDVDSYFLGRAQFEKETYNWINIVFAMSSCRSVWNLQVKVHFSAFFSLFGCISRYIYIGAYERRETFHLRNSCRTQMVYGWR